MSGNAKEWEGKRVGEWESGLSHPWNDQHTLSHPPNQESGGTGEWERGRSGRVGEWESGRVGEWESGRVGEWESGRAGER